MKHFKRSFLKWVGSGVRILLTSKANSNISRLKWFSWISRSRGTYPSVVTGVSFLSEAGGGVEERINWGVGVLSPIGMFSSAVYLSITPFSLLHLVCCHPHRCNSLQNGITLELLSRIYKWSRCRPHSTVSPSPPLTIGWCCMRGELLSWQERLMRAA